MKTNRFTRNLVHAFFASAVFTAFVWVSPAGADWTEDTGQDIVISLKSDPMSHAEAACLAVTLARALKQAGANVTLFPTLDGVALGDKRVVTRPRFKCETPFAPEPISLEENLEAFLDTADDMVVCPICWSKRFDEDPYYGFLPPPCTGPGTPPECTAVAKLLMRAEKVLDF